MLIIIATNYDASSCAKNFIDIIFNPQNNAEGRYYPHFQNAKIEA